jgi:hypothetical protein
MCRGQLACRFCPLRLRRRLGLSVDKQTKNVKSWNEQRERERVVVVGFIEVA